MGVLSKELRDRLPASDFAVPAQRKLPIHDKQHVVLAWSASQDLKGDERLDAQRAILRKAATLQIDTKAWHLRDTVLEARSLDFGEAEEHCNRFPFSGVLTYLDEPSDRPVGGAGGKRVVMTRAAAEAALDSLLGMAVDFTPAFDGHAPTRKMGIITSADIDGNALKISGFLWAADFPEEVSLIRKDKDKLGFSYECRSAVQSAQADPLVVTACQFTGAAVLYKDKAAYMKTSLAARADSSGELTMERDVQEAFQGLNTTLTGLPAAIAAALGTTLATTVSTALKASSDEDKKVKIDAAKANAATLRASATGLKANPLTAAAAALLDAEAAHIESYVAKNEVPPPYVAGTAPAQSAQPLAAAGFTEALKPITDAVASMATKMTDLAHKVETGTGTGTKQADRKTLSASSTALLEKVGIKLEAGKDDGKVKVADLDRACATAALPAHESMALKLALKDAGVLAAS